MSTLWLVNVAKWSKMVNLPVHLGPFWVHLDPFEPFQAIIDFKLKSASAKEHLMFLTISFKSHTNKFVHQLLTKVDNDRASLKMVILLIQERVEVRVDQASMLFSK